MNLSEYIKHYKHNFLDFDQLAFFHQISCLTSHHISASEHFASLAKSFFPAVPSCLAEIPFVPVKYFKSHELISCNSSDITTTLYSSGTTGTPSRIYLDSSTAIRQRQVLSNIFSSTFSLSRPNILVLDTPSTIASSSSLLRKAGILGFSSLVERNSLRSMMIILLTSTKFIRLLN